MDYNIDLVGLKDVFKRTFPVVVAGGLSVDDVTVEQSVCVSL